VGGSLFGASTLARPAVATASLSVDARGRVLTLDGLPDVDQGVQLSCLIHPADRPSLAALVLGAVTTGATVRRLLHVRLGSQYVPAVVQVEDRLADDGALQVRMFAINDASYDLEGLAELAFWDPLTSLANRVLFTQHLRTELQRSLRSGRGTGVLVADVNGLKRVNDQFGHAAGDALLAEVGRRLAASCRPSDTPARLSGDEFAVLCPEVDTDDTARELAGRLSTRVGGELLLPTGPVEVHVAFGWAVSNDDDLRDGGADLLHRADMCMYGAKRFMPASAARSSPGR
jgi:diguanylate cyclase (GGDEF)-like protein